MGRVRYFSGRRSLGSARTGARVRSPLRSPIGVRTHLRSGLRNRRRSVDIADALLEGLREVVLSPAKPAARRASFSISATMGRVRYFFGRRSLGSARTGARMRSSMRNPMRNPIGARMHLRSGLRNRRRSVDIANAPLERLREVVLGPAKPAARRASFSISATMGRVRYFSGRRSLGSARRGQGCESLCEALSGSDAPSIGASKSSSLGGYCKRIHRIIKQRCVNIVRGEGPRSRQASISAGSALRTSLRYEGFDTGGFRKKEARG